MKKVCNGFVTETGFRFKFLCDGYVTESTFLKRKYLIIKDFLCDWYVTEGHFGIKKVGNGFVTESSFWLKILFDGYLMIRQFFNKTALIIKHFLFDGYLTEPHYISVSRLDKIRIKSDTLSVFFPDSLTPFLPIAND